MADIQKVSLQYVVAEDRLALDTEDAAGVTTRLWLTQRLCRGLVAALDPMLRRVTSIRLPDQPPESAQSWEQVAAMSGFGKIPGVQPREDSVSGLVQTVRISPPGGQMTLTFEFGDGGSHDVPLTVTALRQTLAVMHRLHVEAGWPLDVWPAWIADPLAQAGGGSAVN